jgi:uncharacterized membrane protein
MGYSSATSLRRTLLRLHMALLLLVMLVAVVVALLAMDISHYHQQ